MPKLNSQKVALATNKESAVLEFLPTYLKEDYLTFLVTVRSGEFSGQSTFCIRRLILREFAEALMEMSARLIGQATLSDYDSDDFIDFSVDKYGHVKVSGQVEVIMS
jgi:hypothetical protein